MSKTIEIAGSDHIETLRRAGGYYQCPKDPLTARRFGPLVGYAGKYQAPDGSQKQWVGDIYANFAKAEEYPDVLFHFASCMKDGLAGLINSIDVFCGAPIGGYAFSMMLGLVFHKPAIKAEKKTTVLATETMREQSKIVFARHSVERGARYAITEDVCNNFSTTEDLIDIIYAAGGEVTAIICLLNRSLKVDNVFYFQPAAIGCVISVPVVALVRLPIYEYHQDDPFVAEDINCGNMVLKPKDEWNRLMEAMSAAR